MSEDETMGKRAAKEAGGFLVRFAAEIGQGLLEFLVLGVLLLIAFGLFFVNPWVGFGFGAISFIAWSVKTGWTFW